MNKTRKRILSALLLTAVWTAWASMPPAAEAMRIGDICRVKGQETNTLQGLGLVVGLKGTGDGNDPSTIAAISDVLRTMGHPIPIEDASNVALVIVTATIPASGARQGDLLRCRVSSVNGGAKSLVGGTLLQTPLLGPLQPQPTTSDVNSAGPGAQQVFAFAQGKLVIENVAEPVSATVPDGCRLEVDFFNRFTSDGYFTLVLDDDYAGFQMAQTVAELINSEGRYQQDGSVGEGVLARALDQVNIQVRFPSNEYLDDPVSFVSQIQAIRIVMPQSDAKVVINESTGTVVIDADVEIGPVAITHKNVVIKPAGATPGKLFTGVTTEDAGGTRNTKLQALVETLNAIDVPSSDIIDIIKDLRKSGKLYGRVIYE